MKRIRFENDVLILKKSRIHGYGMYAKCDIPAGTRVIEYMGKKLTKVQATKVGVEQIERADQKKELGAVYLFELNKRYDVDGNVDYNMARFINHSCDPNCETDIIRGKIWIISIKAIKKGEEISYNYGYGWDDYEDHSCCCGTNRCIGYILAEDLWARYFRKKKHKAKTQPSRKVKKGTQKKVNRSVNGRNKS